MVDFYKKSNQKLIDTEDITNYPIIRLYKQGNLFQEIYATYQNIDEIVNSLMN